jgi:DUF1707 SHOCT-like domain
VEGSSEIRVSDQQRERAAQELRDHFAAGRLSEDELSERVQKVYSARTERELRALLAALVALIPLLRNAWRLYGPAPQLDRVERELEARERGGRQRHRRRHRGGL